MHVQNLICSYSSTDGIVMALAPLLLCLLSTLVQVHSQMVPNVTFLGNNISNHGYVNLNNVGRTYRGKNSVQCHTDLLSCCTRKQGHNRGDWYFPNGHRVRFSGGGVVFQIRAARRVDLRYLGAGGVSGIYRCDIETNAVARSDGRETTYVGLYSRGGE